MGSVFQNEKWLSGKRKTYSAIMKEEELKEKLLQSLNKKEREKEITEELLEMRKLILGFLDKFKDKIDEEKGSKNQS